MKKLLLTALPVVSFTLFLTTASYSCKNKGAASETASSGIEKSWQNQVSITGDRAKQVMDSAANATGWNNKDSVTHVDSIKGVLQEELLSHSWMKPGDYLFVDSFASATRTYYLAHCREQAGDIKRLHRWQYLIDEYAIIDPQQDRKEILLGPALTEEDREKLRKYNPFQK